MLYKNAEGLQEKIDEYFDYCDSGEDELPCFTGLAYWLGFKERRSLYQIAKNNDDVRNTPIKKALLRIEWSYEKTLRNQSCTGAIFALKNRGWSDKPETETDEMTTIKTILEKLLK